MRNSRLSFSIQLNKRILASGELIFTPSGVSLGQAQLDIFINDWLTADIGYFLAPIGFWNERLDPEWINKLPDVPLVMRQVIPDGLAVSGLQFRGAKYLFGSPIKMEYSDLRLQRLGSTWCRATSRWADQGNVLGTTSGVNNAAAYGGRIGFWIPTRGINFGVSEFVNAPYSNSASRRRGGSERLSALFQLPSWKLGLSVRVRQQLPAYQVIHRQQHRPHRLLHPARLSRLPIAEQTHAAARICLPLTATRFPRDQSIWAAANVSLFGTPMDVPVDRNQYTMGINYYFYASTMLKFAYEINSEVHQSLHDNVFMMQFATNF